MRIACTAAGALALGLAVVGMNDSLAAETRAICVIIGLATALAVAAYIGTTRAEHNKTALAQEAMERRHEEHFAALRTQIEALGAFIRDEMRKGTTEQREDSKDFKIRLESLTGALLEETAELRLAKDQSSRERRAICDRLGELSSVVSGQLVDAAAVKSLGEQVETLAEMVSNPERIALGADEGSMYYEMGRAAGVDDERKRRDQQP